MAGAETKTGDRLPSPAAPRSPGRWPHQRLSHRWGRKWEENWRTEKAVSGQGGSVWWNWSAHMYKVCFQPFQGHFKCQNPYRTVLQECNTNYCKIRIQGNQDNQEAKAKGRIAIYKRSKAVNWSSMGARIPLRRSTLRHQSSNIKTLKYW